MYDPNASPFNALPRVVVALAVVIGGIEAMFQLAGAGLLGGQAGLGWRLAAIQDYAVLDQVFDWMLANNSYPPDQLVRFVAYPLIHAGAIHALFVIVFILAIGKMVAEVFSPLAFLAVFWLSALAGALGFVLILNSGYPLIGGYPGVYGLIGAFTYILWMRLAGTGNAQYRAFMLVGMLLAIQLLFAMLNGAYGNVVADLCGCAAGFGLSFLVSPGGWQRLLARLRQR